MFYCELCHVSVKRKDNYKRHLQCSMMHIENTKNFLQNIVSTQPQSVQQ